MPVENNKAFLRDFAFFLAISSFLFFIKYPFDMSDFKVYYLAGERVIAGDNIYNLADKLEFKYLPVTAVLFSLLSLVANVDTCKVIWYFINSLLIFFTLYKSIKLVKGKYDHHLFYGLLILFIFYLGRELLLGQVNILMILLVITGIERLTKGKEKESGLFIGLSILVKPYTIIFLPYFLINGNYKAFLFALIIFMFGLLTPFFFYGIEGGIIIYTSCLQMLSANSDELYGSIDNISIWGLYVKYFVSLVLSKILALITIIVIYAGLLFSVFKKKATEEKSIIMDCAILLSLIPLFSPQGWFYQMITAILSILCLFVYFKHIPLPQKIALIVVLMTIPLSVYDVSGKTFSRWLGNHSVLTLSLFIIVLFNFLLRFHSALVLNGSAVIKSFKEAPLLGKFAYVFRTRL